MAARGRHSGLLQLEGCSQEDSGHQANFPPSSWECGRWPALSWHRSPILGLSAKPSMMGRSHPSDQIHIGLAVHMFSLVFAQLTGSCTEMFPTQNTSCSRGAHPHVATFLSSSTLRSLWMDHWLKPLPPLHSLSLPLFPKPKTFF